MIYPKGYEWLGTVGALPRTISEALPLYGTLEAAGAANSPTILAWAKETGLDREGYSADSIAWCGLFAALVVKRAGYAPPPHPLWALNWGGFGAQGHQPCLGDVLVFVRPGGGHVGFYIAEDDGAYHVLGGNTSDQVKIARIEKQRLHAVRSPMFKVGRPASSKPYVVKSNGALSRNEA
jgi:uncharacterized protein (TIGR02594 family)